jgi:hypothetical protein
MEHCWNHTDRKKLKNPEKTCLGATLSTINPTWTALALNSGLHSKNQWQTTWVITWSRNWTSSRITFNVVVERHATLTHNKWDTTKMRPIMEYYLYKAVILSLHFITIHSMYWCLFLYGTSPLSSVLLTFYI